MKCKRIGCKGYRSACSELFSGCRDRKVGFIGETIETIQLIAITAMLLLITSFANLFYKKGNKNGIN